MCHSTSSPTSNGPYRSKKCLVRSFLCEFNPLMVAGVSHPFQLDESFSIIGLLVVFFILHIWSESPLFAHVPQKES